MLALHRGACTSLSEPVFWDDGSGGRERRYSKSLRCPRTCGRSETSPDLDPKDEGERRIRRLPDDDDDAPPCLCSGPGPATVKERKQWEAEGEKASTQ